MTDVPARWLAVWPVNDPSMSSRELVAEAAADLPDVARRHRHRVIGVEKWRRCPGRLVPGSGGAPEVITAACWVLPYERPVNPDWPDTAPDKATAADKYADYADVGCTWDDIDRRTRTRPGTARDTLTRAGRHDITARIDRTTLGAAA